MPQSHNGFDRYCARYPPSTGSTAPVMKEASSEARKTMATGDFGGFADAAHRVHLLNRREIVSAAQLVRELLDPLSADRSGATALTLMPRSAHSTARCLVRPVATNLAGRRPPAASARPVRR